MNDEGLRTLRGELELDVERLGALDAMIAALDAAPED